MAATNTGTNNIDIAPENDDFDDAHVDVQTNDDDTGDTTGQGNICLLYTSPSPRDRQKSRMPSSA